MRDRRLEASTLALLAVVGGFVWLTRHPEAEIVRRAEAWPVVGPLAIRFRAYWLPPPPPAPPAAEPPVVESAHRFATAGAPPHPPPSPRRPPAAIGAPSSGGPPSGPVPSGQLPVLPEAPHPATPALVALARGLLDAGAEAIPVGGYTLLTDVDDTALLERWRAIAGAIEPAWRARYGVAPIGTPVETVVLFARASAYRTLQRAEPALAPLDANGFAFAGLVALTAEGLGAAELDATFQHELAHLLARRSIGPALPAWLAEGVAEEFGQAPFDAGRFDFGAVRGSVIRTGNRFELHGGIALLDRLLRRIDRGALPTPAELAPLAEAEFSIGPAALDRYAAAFAWTRFLLADPARGDAFRRFLAGVAAGEAPAVERLEAELGTRWPALVPALAAWLVELRDRTYRRAGVPLGELAEPLDEVAPSPLPAPPPGTRLSSSRQPAPPSA